MSQLLLYLCTGTYDITSQKTVLLIISLFVVICCILFIFLNPINNTFILNVCISLQSCFILCPIQVKYCKCCSTRKYTLHRRGLLACKLHLFCLFQGTVKCWWSWTCESADIRHFGEAGQPAIKHRHNHTVPEAAGYDNIHPAGQASHFYETCVVRKY